MVYLQRKAQSECICSGRALCCECCEFAVLAIKIAEVSLYEASFNEGYFFSADLQPIFCSEGWFYKPLVIFFL
jgi:hypothetical protein